MPRRGITVFLSAEQEVAKPHPGRKRVRKSDKRPAHEREACWKPGFGVQIIRHCMFTYRRYRCDGDFTRSLDLAQWSADSNILPSYDNILKQATHPRKPSRPPLTIQLHSPSVTKLSKMSTKLFQDVELLGGADEETS